MQRFISFVILAFTLLVIVQAKPWCNSWSCSQQWDEGGSDYNDGGNDYDGGYQGGYGGGSQGGYGGGSQGGYGGGNQGGYQGNGGGSRGGNGGGNGGSSGCDGNNCNRYAINRLGTGHHNTNNVHMYKQN